MVVRGAGTGGGGDFGELRAAALSDPVVVVVGGETGLGAVDVVVVDGVVVLVVACAIGVFVVVDVDGVVVVGLVVVVV